MKTKIKDLNTENFKKEYYNAFMQPPIDIPNTPFEIAMLVVFKDWFRFSERMFIGGRISRDRFVNDVNLLNHVISRTCHKLKINLDCIVMPSLSGEYFKPNKMPRRINEEEYENHYKSEFKKVRKTFDEIRDSVLQSNREAEEKEKNKGYDFIQF